MAQYTEIHQCNPLYKQTPWKKSHMIISLHAEKAFSKIQRSFMIKSLGKIRNARPMPKHIRAIYIQPVDSIKLNREKLEAILLKSGIRQGSQTLPIYSI